MGGEIDPAAIDSTLDGLGGKIPVRAWRALLASGTPRRYDSGGVLVRQGEPGRHVLALNYGLVKVTRFEPDGHEMVLAVRGRGEVIGESTYLGNQPRSATVTAIGLCVTYIIPHLTFWRTVEDFGLNSLVLRHLTDRLRESEEMRSELANLPPRRRIARVLLRFSRGGELALVQAELARAGRGMCCGWLEAAITPVVTRWAQASDRDPPSIPREDIMSALLQKAVLRDPLVPGLRYQETKVTTGEDEL